MKDRSPNLVIISNHSEKESDSASESREGKFSGGGAERRKIFRLNLSSEQFRLAANGKIFPVSDLSAGGLALRILDPADLLHFQVGADLDGLINLRRLKYVVHGKVRSIGRDRVGCEFLNLPEETQAALRAYLDPVHLGQELKLVPAESGQLCYYGPSGTHLFLWQDLPATADALAYPGPAGTPLSRWALFMLGSFVQWDAVTGLTTGKVNSSYEASENRGVLRFETFLLSADAKPDPGLVAVAKTLILSSNLPKELGDQCGKQLLPDH